MGNLAVHQVWLNVNGGQGKINIVLCGEQQWLMEPECIPNEDIYFVGELVE